MSHAATLRAMVDELVAAGIRDVIVCPGSRSTPIALATKAHPALRVRVLLDERSAGYFALGLARAARRPVAVVVTSGTAVANLLPATVEANLSRVPLLLLTADRPAELRDRGAPQTIDQVRIFGEHVRWFAELPLPDGERVTLDHVAAVVGRAVAIARGGSGTAPGPVHLNLPYREPLIPDGPLGPACALERPPFTDTLVGRSTLATADVAGLAARLPVSGRGLIVAGPQDDPSLPAALVRLAAATGYPIVADPLSGVRCGGHDRGQVIAHVDHLARPGPWREAHLPEIVLRFGAAPTSKPLATLLAEAVPVQIVVDGDSGWREPAIIPTTFVHADPVATALALAEHLVFAGDAPIERQWARAWSDADAIADRALRAWLAARTQSGEPFEGLPFALLGDLLPNGGLLWAGNSMPVRDMDAWLPLGERVIRPLSNRGANGIDGVVSTALGSAAAGVGPVALVVGDVSFLHDLNALVAARLHDLSATIVLVDNDGGGIFSFLPQASAVAPEVGLPEHYEELFGTPHGIDVGPIVTALGGEFREVSAGDLRAAIADSLARPGVQVLRFRTDRDTNVRMHREAAAAVSAAVAASVAASIGAAAVGRA
ncbi:MAG: 2-succinyl-6-hydroxy-2,4-cyclohexadiene-1-carboxylic acid synthase/2-oxoglutarate decarboxylase [Chloroflexi bacterium]|nr:2-succinyl-6-hydroxy-2,4-cyclohexadiene-1-carboxylic acid synthase/2-oxoglutarate decarboxylase [Chloroflexota bacterium]